MIARTIAALIVITAALVPSSVRAEAWCHVATVTAYSAEMYPGTTADGTSTWGAIERGEYIAAGPRHLLGRSIEVHTNAGSRVYRIADTGNLAVHSIDYDLLFATTEQARLWGRVEVTVCVL